MEIAMEQDQKAELRTMSLRHFADGSIMRFHENTWKHFNLRQIEERLNQWTETARGPQFRRPLGWAMEGEDLVVRLPALPSGYRPLSAVAEMELTERQKAQVLISLCEALAVLHIGKFVMGFLHVEQVYVQEQTLDVFLDVQAFPTTTPFVDNLLDDYPFILFSRYSRMHVLPRAADYTAVGLLIQWMFLEAFPQELRTLAGELPQGMAELSWQLLNQPTDFLFIDEVADAIRGVYGEPARYLDTEVGETFPSCLHPMEAPISKAGQELFRRFLRADGVGLLGVISADDTARVDVVRQHLSEVLEHDMFITIACRDLPFATLRETIERTLAVAEEFLPHMAGRLRSLYRQLERLLNKHHEGDDVYHALADWLMSMFDATSPLYQFQSVYYLYENVEEFDEDSQRVFLHFWRKFKDSLPRLHSIYSGREMPNLFATRMPNLWDMACRQGEELYEHLLFSMLGRCEPGLLRELTGWMTEHRINTSFLRLVVETLIEEGQIVLRRDGWQRTTAWAPDLDALAVDRLIAARIERCSREDRELLNTLACIPAQIRARAMFVESGLDTAELFSFLQRMDHLGLLKVYQEDSVFVPVEVAEQLLSPLPQAERESCYERARVLQERYRPFTLPPLIELATHAGNKRLVYFYLIRYFRQIRSMLSYERMSSVLEQIYRLHQELGRRCRYWNRRLVHVSYRMKRFAETEALALEMYEQTGEAADWYQLTQVRMVLNSLDVADVRAEVARTLFDRDKTLTDRVYGALICYKSDIIRPLRHEGARTMYRFYKEEVYPHRQSLSVRMFAQVTITHAIMLFQYFPEQADTATVLLEMLESMLEESQHADLVPVLYESYGFHHNVGIGRRYNQRVLEMARRSGSLTRKQIGHLNGMEMALLQGDAQGFRYHREHTGRFEEFRRKDVKEQYLLHHLLYATEWEDAELFRQTEQQMQSDGMTLYAKAQWEVYRRYIAFRQGVPLPPAPDMLDRSQYVCFGAALYALERGDVRMGLDNLIEAIAVNGANLIAGWAYRELLSLLLQQGASESGAWLSRYEQYLKDNSLELFWPDYYRLCAEWEFRRDDLQRGILYLRRALNAYQLIEKTTSCARVAELLEANVQPTYLPQDASLRRDPAGQRLLEERVQFLHQSLDLMIIIQLSEQVTESLELSTTIQELTSALFEYFPVTQVAVSYDLAHRQEKTFHNASGLVSEHELLVQRRQCAGERHAFMLYQSGKQSLTLEVTVQDLSEAKRRHMEHFLAFLKPHIANAIHYMEMMIDTLTGFYQRRYFSEQLKQELDISERYGLDLSLIMLDIDNFRLVNEHGHQEGDKVLRELADIVRGILRKNDIPGRYGGEELLLILPKTDGHAAWKVACKIREEIEAEFAFGRPYRVTVSVGVSSLRLCGVKTEDELIYLADTAEITAKTTGKNKVIAAWNL